MRMLLGCQFQWYLTRITWHLRLTLLCFSTAVNKVRCYRCPPRSNLLSNFCESDFGKQGLFNTTNECAYHFLVWDISWLRLQFRDWKHIVIDRSNNGQLLLFVTQPEVKIGEHIVFVENISIYKLESQLKLLLTNTPLNVLYCGALLSSELELLLRLFARIPCWLKKIFNLEFVHLAIEGSLEEIKSTYGDGGINTSVLMVKVMGVFRGTDAIQNKIIKIDFAANLKRLVIWLLKPPYSQMSQL